VALLYLLTAIAAEIGATFTARSAEGFTRLLPSILTLGLVGAAYFAFSLSLRAGMNIGVGYATWAALGVALVAVLGAVVVGDALTWLQWLGIVLVAVGVMALQLGSTT